MNRRTVAAACLAASPLLVSLSHFLWPAHSEGTDAEQIAAAGTHAAAWAAATIVETVGWVLLVPALFALWQEARARGRVLTGVGVWLAIAGIFGYYGAGLMNLVTIEVGRHQNNPSGVALVQAMKHDPALFWMLVAPLLLGTLAFALVFAGLARAGWIGWWAPAAVFVGLIASQALSASDNPLLLTAAFAPLTVTFVVAAARLAGLRPAPLDAPAPAYAVT